MTTSLEKKIKIGLVQFEIKFDGTSLQKIDTNNVDRLIEYLGNMKNIDLAILPEGTTLDPKNIDKLAEVAQNSGIYLIAGSFEDNHNRLYLLGPNGSKQIYDKRVLYGAEAEKLTPGDEIKTWKIYVNGEEYLIRPLICADMIQFNDYILEEEIDFNVVASNFDLETLDKAMEDASNFSRESNKPVLVVNNAGHYKDLDNHKYGGGQSRVVLSNGEIQSGGNNQQIAYFELSNGRIENFHEEELI